MFSVSEADLRIGPAKTGLPTHHLLFQKDGSHNGMVCHENTILFNSPLERRNGKFPRTPRRLAQHLKLHHKEDWNIRMERLDSSRIWILLQIKMGVRVLGTQMGRSSPIVGTGVLEYILSE
jgi:hypothetical protein